MQVQTIFYILKPSREQYDNNDNTNDNNNDNNNDDDDIFFQSNSNLKWSKDALSII